MKKISKKNKNFTTRCVVIMQWIAPNEEYSVNAGMQALYIGNSILDDSLVTKIWNKLHESFDVFNNKGEIILVAKT